ncbi:uncharacterized protein K452DRAFT_265099 [Aplosporella prunicola CBS 121167]|uniref:Zn(2)-C6 fungal-type domain-containing protein n=1 Tax=Aplosporella prunicola CBS 121167 TaxID=1176127 RepID=A0A6A6BR51_9PEZI|nr:uncharacterized protein K452DRAFT_265099 [Aplosporella prunicola CBS 121167]KAF2145775.1 hypothetical protein K452DRAFT_265099 [Aplosporella prunicola CBS 121167]
MSASPASLTDMEQQHQQHQLHQHQHQHQQQQQQQQQQQRAQQTAAAKRKASTAGLDANGTGRSVKRRASKACQCCRARKVRCNVTEHGAPCTNCRLDEVECIVSESRRKKKWSKDDDAANNNTADVNPGPAKRRLASRDALDGLTNLEPSPAAHHHRLSHDADSLLDEHVPHSIYQTHGQRLNYSFSELDRRVSSASSNGFPILGYSPISTDSRPSFPYIAPKQNPAQTLPLYIKPLPPRIGPDEIAYLEKKGALSIPSPDLRTELLRAYVEFVHPYMPLLDLHEFLLTVDHQDGSFGKTSLILFQAVMFAGSAFADMKQLRRAGFANRKEARKDFFQKTRLLYDFDYESDRVSLVQALLLLTYYYETPDDQKDTWHWMGVATSVAHTIGLHRNPDKSNMDSKRTKLWKRIWWSTYMRDRLIALGMRRPTRIKNEDYDVPMLTLDDFDIAALPESVTCIPADCIVARDTETQRKLALMCIQKAKLCLCISHVLSKQYCVLNNNQGLLNDRTTMMLLPKKLDPQKCEVKACDEELQRWQDGLPDEVKYEEASSGNPSIDLHKALLHMIFYTTLSALHRPQVLPSGPGPAPAGSDGTEVLDVSRRNVRRAATAITGIAQKLDTLDLVRYLPTTGVTVLLPAIIIHLLDIKAPDESTRRTSLRGFCQCMQVMGKLRDLYAAADYSTAFLEAAIRKAGINIAPVPPPPAPPAAATPQTTTTLSGVAGKPGAPHLATTVDDLVNAGRRMDTAAASSTTTTTLPAGYTITPPPDNLADAPAAAGPAGAKNTPDDEVARRLETFLASTPPASDHHASDASQPDLDGTGGHAHAHAHADALDLGHAGGADLFPWSLDAHVDALGGFGGAGAVGATADAGLDDGVAAAEFDALLNMDAVGDAFGLHDFGAGAAHEGEGAGVWGAGGDVEWMRGVV